MSDRLDRDRILLCNIELLNFFVLEVATKTVIQWHRTFLRILLVKSLLPLIPIPLVSINGILAQPAKHCVHIARTNTSLFGFESWSSKATSENMQEDAGSISQHEA